MAYDQYSNYQQPQQQYYGAPPAPAQQAPYDPQYDNYAPVQDSYGYDGYNNGYYDEYSEVPYSGGHGPPNGLNHRPPPRNHRGGHNGMNGQPRYAPHEGYGPQLGSRRPVGRGGYPQDSRHGPQGPGYRRQPLPPNQNGRHHGSAHPGGRGYGEGYGPQGQYHGGYDDSTGRPPLPRPNDVSRPSVKQSVMGPEQPRQLAMDSPFPAFPAKHNAGPREPSLDQSMAEMNIRDNHPPRAQRRPHSGSGHMGERSLSGPSYGHAHELPTTLPPRSQTAVPQQERRGYKALQGPAPSLQASFGPQAQPKRAMTMPQNEFQELGNQSTQREQWTEPGPVAGYHGPASPSYIPPGSPPAAGAIPAASVPDINVPQGRPLENGPRPEAPQSHNRHESLGELYDNYLGAPDQSKTPLAIRRESAIEREMPNFDEQPVVARPEHRRGDSIDHHLGAAATATPSATTVPSVGAPPPVNSASKPYKTYDTQSSNQTSEFYHQARQSQSQPNLRKPLPEPRSEGVVYEMPGDVPSEPLPRMNSAASAPSRQGLPPGPSPAVNGGRPPPPRPMYGTPQPMPPQGYPQYDQQYQGPAQAPPPIQRNMTAQSQWSDPGPRGPAMTPYPAQNRQFTPGPQSAHGSGSGQQPGAPPLRFSNPDALPQHPAPVRPGHVPEGATQPARPPPVRQYNANSAPAPVPSPAQAPPLPPRSEKRLSGPVTHEELERLRGVIKSNHSDYKTALKLVKKLVEAASVLADEGGRADIKTKNKNRERYIMEAHKIVKKLCNHNYPEAMFYMADSYGQGLLGLPVDPKEAFSLYQSAAKLGHAASAYRTAVCCEMGPDEGGGTKKDPMKAVQWYKRAAALGDTPAMYKMGMILLKGLLGVQKNVGEALTWLKRAAERADEENPHALHELGLLYENPVNTDKIIKDEAYSFSLFKQAADLGYKFSQFRVAQSYEYGLLGSPIDARVSIVYYTRAAAQGEHQSELALSGWYLTGSKGILEQSDTEAYLWARKAATAEPPLPKAMFAMGYFTEVGIGCPRSLEEAKRWYGRAAAHKFPKAQERLEELKRGGVRVQKNRERLSRGNQKQHEADCVIM